LPAAPSARLSTGRGTPQRHQVVPPRHRAHHPDQQQRHLRHRPCQPSPQRDAGGIGPLQVVDDQDRGLYRALLGDQRQQLLGQRGGDVHAAIGGHFAAQQPDDGALPRIRRRLPDPQPFEQRQQR
jgi:hypothetical protein